MIYYPNHNMVLEGNSTKALLSFMIISITTKGIYINHLPKVSDNVNNEILISKQINYESFLTNRTQSAKSH